MKSPDRGEDVATPSSGRRELVLALLQATATPLWVVDIAQELGVHPNTVRFHLDHLVKAGRAEPVTGEVTGRGRPPISYRASRTMDREGPSNYRLLAAMLTQHLEATATEPAGTAIALGRAWGPALVRPTTDSGTMRKDGAVTRMVRVLDELGFKPEPVKSARTRQIRLRHCPFLDLVDDHEVICSIHLGLMQGVMAGEGNGSLTVGRLDPFVEPDLCVAHLTRMQA